jgi:membrane protein YqaA with SNARE-associated domain
MIRKIYDWVMSWAGSPYATWALFWLALAESSFFPVPPDVLLMALSLSNPAKAFLYAGISTIGSVLGGLIGYFLGLGLMEVVGMPIIEFYGVAGKFEVVREFYGQNAFLTVAAAGFTPIPYKVFTIAAGACEINIFIFALASIVSRGARFYIVSGLIYKFGEPVKIFIDKYFNLLTILFVILLAGGFAIVKLIMK